MRIALVLLSLLLVAPAGRATPPRWPTSTTARSGCPRSTAPQKVRLAPHRWSTRAATPRSGSRSRSPTAAGSSPRATSRAGSSSFSWFKVWEPNGTSTVEGPLNAPSGWSIYVYPLGFDITADGAHMVYGYSNSSGCCPINFARGTYVRPVTNSSLEPIDISGHEEPTLFGSRVIAHVRRGRSYVQDPATTYETTSRPGWTSPASGSTCAAPTSPPPGSWSRCEFEQWNGGGRRWARSPSCSIAGVDAAGDLPGRGRLLPAGVRHRQGRLALPGRPLDRVDRRPGPEGRRHADDGRTTVRADVAAGRDRGGRDERVDRRRGRRALPAAGPAAGAADAPARRRRPPGAGPATIAAAAPDGAGAS